MPQEPALRTLSELSAPSTGMFRAEHATALGVTSNQLARLRAQGVIERAKTAAADSSPRYRYSARTSGASLGVVARA